MITIRQKLKTEDYKKALYTHFFSYGYTFISPVLGISLLLTLLTLWGIYGFDFDYRTVLVVLISLFLISRPMRYVYQVLSSYKTSPDFGKEMQIQFWDEEDKIVATSKHSSSTFIFKNLYAYCNKKRFFFLYASNNQFMILDKNQMKNEEVSTLLEWVNKRGIKKR